VDSDLDLSPVESDSDSSPVDLAQTWTLRTPTQNRNLMTRTGTRWTRLHHCLFHSVVLRRQHLCYDDCLDGKMEECHNSSVLYMCHTCALANDLLYVKWDMVLTH